MTRRRMLIAVMASGALVVAACSGSVRLPDAVEGQAPPSTVAVTPAAPQCTAEQKALDPTRSYAPDGPLPAPDALPANSTMAAIRARGKLIVGVSADTLLFGARNPLTQRHRGVRHRHVEGGRQGDLRSRWRVEHHLQGHHLRRSPAQPGGRSRQRRRRHRRPHHDDQLRPLAADRVLVDVLRRRPARAGEEGFRVREHRRTQRRQRPRCAHPRAAPTSNCSENDAHRATANWSCWPSPTSPTASSPCSRVRPTARPATTPCWPGSPRRTPTPRSSATSSPTSPTASAWARTRSTS